MGCSPSTSVLRGAPRRFCRKLGRPRAAPDHQRRSGLRRCRRDAVGEPGWYLDRPGFAWGGIGVAAVWYGATVAVARRVVRARHPTHAADQLGRAPRRDSSISPLTSARDALEAAAVAGRRVRGERPPGRSRRAAARERDCRGRRHGGPGGRPRDGPSAAGATTPTMPSGSATSAVRPSAPRRTGRGRARPPGLGATGRVGLVRSFTHDDEAPLRRGGPTGWRSPTCRSRPDQRAAAGRRWRPTRMTRAWVPGAHRHGNDCRCADLAARRDVR